MVGTHNGWCEVLIIDDATSRSKTIVRTRLFAYYNLV